MPPRKKRADDKAKTIGAASRDDLTTFDTTRARIPVYDPSGDQYCPSAHTAQYKRRQKEVQRRVRADQLSKTAPPRSQSATYDQRAKTPRTLDPIREPVRGVTPPRGAQRSLPVHDLPKTNFSLSTLSGGITYGGAPPITSPGDTLPNSKLRPLSTETSTALRRSPRTPPEPPLDDWQAGSVGSAGGLEWQAKSSKEPGQELEVLKTILLREGYLKRLEGVISQWLGTNNLKQVPSGLGDLFDLLRTSSTEVCEHIVRWRLAIGDFDNKPMPFLWNGINYLLKMPSDLDDLNLLPALRRWSGFTLQRNPFLLPLPLDHRSTTSTERDYVPERLEDDEAPVLYGDAPMVGPHPGRGRRKPTKGPYRTPVVNDPALIQASKPKKVLEVTEEPAVRRKGESAPLQVLVNGQDLARVRAAESVILDEEAREGRFARNHNGQLVPAAQVEDEEHVKRLALDRGRPLDEPARAPRSMAPYAGPAGIGYQDPDSGDEEGEAKRRWSQRAVADDPSKNPVKSEQDELNSRSGAMRAYGALGPLQSASTMGRRRAPTKRSRGMALDADIGRLKREASRLEREAKAVRVEMKADLEEVQLLERDADRLEAEAAARDAMQEKQSAAEIQRAQRGKAAREEARSRAQELKDDIAKAEIRAKELEEGFELRTHDYEKRQKERTQLKRNERVIEDKRRAVELERARRLLPPGGVHPADERKARTLEDISATSITRMVRGVEARFYAKRLRRVYARAATIIAAGIRGKISRIYAKKIRTARYAAWNIQRVTRGRQARARYYILLQRSHQQIAAVRIQTAQRGRAARRRVFRRMELRRKALAAAEAVGVRKLFAQDLKELATAIQEAQVDSRLAFPPAAVLGLVRIMMLMLSEDGGGALGTTLSDYTAIGTKHGMEVERNDLSWTGAVKVLRRGHWLLRRLRFLAAGPASVPPRLLSLPLQSLELLRAYDNDPTMSLDAMERVVMGRKACVQLLTFVQALRIVYEVQSDFFEQLGGDESTPNWLIRRRVGAQRRRALQALRDVDYHDVESCGAALRAKKALGQKFPVEATCLDAARLRFQASDDELKAQDAAEAAHSMKDVVKVREEKVDRELDCQKCIQRVKFADDSLTQATKDARATGSTTTLSRLPKLRADCTEARIDEREARSKLALVRRNASVAAKRRKTIVVELPPEVTYRSAACGEARCAAALTKEALKRWFRDRGGETHVRKLASRDLRSVTGSIDERQQQVWSKSKGSDLARLNEEDDSALKEFDKDLDDCATRLRDAEEALKRVREELECEISKAEDDERAREQKPVAALEATDEERAEDCREDEFCAVEELLLDKRFVPEPFLPQLSMERAAEAKRRARKAEEAMAKSLGKSAITREGELEAEKELDATLIKELEPWEQNPPPRPRPLLILVARDIPSIAKRKIIDRLCRELEGEFVRVCSELPQGIDPEAFQAPLSVGKSVLADVDSGVAHDCRHMFIDALAFCKAALFPSPRVMLVLGDPRNRRGACAPSPAGHYGVSIEDLNQMADYDLKRDLQDAAEHLARLTESEALENLADWALQERPLSLGHALAMEAAIILLTRSRKFRGPDRTVTAVAWLAARRLLARPVELVAKLRDFDAATLPPQTLFVLKEYIEHENWPLCEVIVHEGASLITDPENEDYDTYVSSLDGGPSKESALGPLISWIASVVSAGSYLAKHGGPAPPISRQEPPDLVHSVVTVSDGHTELEEESEAAGRGYRAASAQLLDAALEDCRGYRCAAKLASTRVPYDDGTTPPDAIYNVNVAHDCGRIFFSAYDPSTSTRLVTSVHERDVDRLLAPNSIEHREHTAKLPPRSLKEMYARLVKLLVVNRGTNQALANRPPRKSKLSLLAKPARISKLRKVTPPTLMCRRKLRRLMRETRRISGYLCTLTVYEEARGELRVHAYLPERSASLEKAVGMDLLHDIVTGDADPKIKELSALESHDAETMLPYIADRMEIVPSKASAEDMGSLSHYLALAAKDTGGAKRSAGFKLRLRQCKGPGRTVFKQFATISNMKVVLSVIECGGASRRVLRLLLYDPLSAETREIRLADTHRAVLLDSIGGDWRLWRESLLKRLSLRRKRVSSLLEGYNSDEEDGERFIKYLPEESGIDSGAILDQDGVTFDSTLHNRACKIKDKRCRLTIELKAGDGEGLVVKVMELRPTTQTEFVVTKERLAALWALEDNARPVYTVLGNKHTRDEGIQKLVEGLTRDRETGRVMLASVSAEAKQRKKAPSPFLKVKPRRRPSREEVEGSDAPFFRRFDGVQSTFGHPSERVEEAHDGTIEHGHKFRRQPPVVFYEHALPPPPDAGDFSQLVWFDDASQRPPPPVDEAEAPAPAPSDAPAPAPAAVAEAEAPAQIEETVITDMRLIFQQGVRSSIKPLEPKNWPTLDALGLAKELVFVKVFEQYTSGVAVRQLRFEAYRHTTSGAECAIIEDLKHLRMTLGPAAQHLLAGEREEEMLLFLIKNRMILCEGLIDDETDLFVKSQDRFTIKWTTDRIFDARFKVTPLGLGGDDDEDANAHRLFDQGALHRGKKILRHAQAVDGALVHVNVFELPEGVETSAPSPAPAPSPTPAPSPAAAPSPAPALESLPLPHLRFVCWNPLAKHRSMFIVPPEACREVMALEDAEQATKGLKAERTPPSFRLANPLHRFDLALAITKRLRLSCSHRAPPDAFLPWSGGRAAPLLHGPDPEPLGEDYDGGLSDDKHPMHDKTKDKRNRRLQYGVSIRKEEDRINRRSRRRRLFRVSTRVGKAECIVSVYHAIDTELDLDFNVCVPRIRRACEIRITGSDQRHCMGRPCLEHAQGEPRKAAIDWLIRHLRLQDVPSPEELRTERDWAERRDAPDSVKDLEEKAPDPLPEMTLSLDSNPEKPWLSAYQGLDTTIKVDVVTGEGRPHGVPLAFIPLQTSGDLVLRKGMALPHGGDCIITVTTRAPGEPAVHGLVIQAYDPVTSYTAKLHLGAREIIKLIEFQEDRMTDPELIESSVSRYILKRLIVEASPVGGLQLTIARIPKKLQAQGVHDTFYAGDPEPGSEVVEPPPSPPSTPLRVKYDNTVPTPGSTPRPASAGSAPQEVSFIDGDAASMAPAPAPAPAPGERNASPP